MRTKLVFICVAICALAVVSGFSQNKLNAFKARIDALDRATRSVATPVG